MTPYERARAVYDQEACARPFDEDLRLHLLNGYVHSTPEFFIMGRPVRQDATPDAILDPAVRHENPDCWLVYLAAGDISKFLAREPYELPWVAWERKNVLRFYKFHEVRKKLCMLERHLLTRR